MEDKSSKQDEFIKLRAEGNSFNAIAKKLKVSKSTLIGWSKDFQQEVDNAKAMEREAKIEQYQMSRLHQLEMFGEQLKQIREVVSQRTLSDVPTDRLITAEIKLLDAVNNLGMTTRLRVGDDEWKEMMSGEKEWEA